MLNRILQWPFDKLPSHSSKDLHWGTSTSRTVIFEQQIKAMPPPFRSSLEVEKILYLSGVHSNLTAASVFISQDSVTANKSTLCS